ncbi:MAG: DUF721 domain-containing protein [Clostridiales bacterium]|nr:DUF721 domain-containing protein [Clostridiales bacterium]
MGRGGGPERLGEVLARIAKPLGYGRAVKAIQIADAWEQVAGEEIASRTGRVSFRDGELSVSVDSHAWATQLGALSEELRIRLNSALGDPIVHRVRFTVGGPDRDGASGATQRSQKGGRSATRRVDRKPLDLEDAEAIEGSAAIIKSETLRSAAISATKSDMEWKKARRAATEGPGADGELTDPTTGLLP